MAALEIACRAALAVLFAAAVVGKARSPDAFLAFRSSLAGFGLPDRPMFAAALVATEAAAAALVLAWPAAGFLLAALLLVAFTAAITAVLRRGDAVSCRCFGRADVALGPEHLVRNGLLLLAAGLGLAASLTGAPPPPLATAAAAALLGAAAGALVTRWDDLVFLVRGPRDPHTARR